MKNLVNEKSVRYLFLMGVSLILLQGCAVYSPTRYPPVTVADIVQMSKNKVPPDQIISAIRKSQTVYNLKADQLAKLSDEGVSDLVINYMEKTHMDAIAQNQRLEDSYYWWPGWDGYLYGGPAFGWPYNYWRFNWGPSVIIRGHEGDEEREDHGSSGRGERH